MKNHTASTNIIEIEQTQNHIAVESFFLQWAIKQIFLRDMYMLYYSQYCFENYISSFNAYHSLARRDYNTLPFQITCPLSKNHII